MFRAPLRTSRGILSATVLLFLLSAIVQPASLSSSAFAGLIPFACVLGLVALGQTLVIQQGGIDLSVPGVVSLSGVIVSYYSSGAPGLGGSTLGLAIFYAVVAALIAGLINGMLVAYARVAPIVATLGMNAVLYGFDVNVSGGTPVQVPESLLAVRRLQDIGRIVARLHCGRHHVHPHFSYQEDRVRTHLRSRWRQCARRTRDRRRGRPISGVRLCGRFASILLGRHFSRGLDASAERLSGRRLSDCRRSLRSFLAAPRFWAAPGILPRQVIAALFLTQLQQLVLTTDAGVGVQFLFQGAAIIVGVGVYSLNLQRLAEYVRTFGGPGLAAERVGGSST